MTQRPTAVLIHGAWAGPWVWDRVREPLLRAGVESIAVTLPGVGPTLDEPAELDDIAIAVIGQVADVDGPLLLVGHSGGGIVATHVAEQICERVCGVVYVAGMMLPSGWGFGRLCDDAGLRAPVGIAAFLDSTDDSTVTSVSPEAAVSVFFHDADPADAIAASRMVAPQQESGRLISPLWTPERFGQLPRLYIEVTRDRSVPLVAQRHMQELVPGARVVTLDSDHGPQLSQPAAVVDAILAAVGAREWS
ncbi:alpha/beta fold hydrolase [Gordonia sp. 852002-10350_SCH5691597]|uniref:alpha/beta fold hydrolase n=1 Tax=Gordonia sp. 852002-10350_SCH5691597 TaxID=1834085 RepID=UPI0007EA14CA|nr:alpha/beta hydrolase [Gordonia sp. 852002-10350_SCH5691597]OBA59578.1 esterase [Gordonia sp. 852002-10350_SCH5691597]